MGRSLGLGMREFKNSVSGIGSHDDTERPEPLPSTRTTAAPGEET
jgi:Sec-independent protein translocase protein TatA